MHPNVDITFKNLQFCFPSDKQAQIFVVGGQNSRLTAGSNITDPMIKINSYMGETHLEPYISPQPALLHARVVNIIIKVQQRTAVANCS